MNLLIILDWMAEIIHLVFDLGVFTRRHIIPALVYIYCVVDHYIVPAFSIPVNYWHVRRHRLGYEVCQVG